MVCGVGGCCPLCAVTLHLDTCYTNHLYFVTYFPLATLKKTFLFCHLTQVCYVRDLYFVTYLPLTTLKTFFLSTCYVHDLYFVTYFPPTILTTFLFCHSTLVMFVTCILSLQRLQVPSHLLSTVKLNNHKYQVHLAPTMCSVLVQFSPSCLINLSQFMSTSYN